MPERKPDVLISSQLLATVQDHARRDYPREACGFLIGVQTASRFDVREVWTTANTAAIELQTAAYRIDPRDWIRVEKLAVQQGREIIGIYHSHPDQSAAISQTDIALLWPNLIYLIVSSGSQASQPQRVGAWILDENTGKAILCKLNTTTNLLGVHTITSIP